MSSLAVGIFVQVDVSNRIIDQLSERDERVTGAKRGPAGHVWSRRRKLILRSRNHTGPAVPGANLANTSPVHAEVGSNIMLPIASADHSLDDSNFSVIQSHERFPLGRLQRRVYATLNLAPGGG
jgi:hypothetical protein